MPPPAADPGGSVSARYPIPLVRSLRRRGGEPQAPEGLGLAIEAQAEYQIAPDVVESQQQFVPPGLQLDRLTAVDFVVEFGHRQGPGVERLRLTVEPTTYGVVPVAALGVQRNVRRDGREEVGQGVGDAFVFARPIAQPPAEQLVELEFYPGHPPRQFRVQPNPDSTIGQRRGRSFHDPRFGATDLPDIVRQRFRGFTDTRRRVLGDDDRRRGNPDRSINQHKIRRSSGSTAAEKRGEEREEKGGEEVGRGFQDCSHRCVH